MTVCYECKHFHNSEPNGPRADIWYNHYCKAVKRETGINPVTGKKEYMDQGSLTSEQYPYCRDINIGNCPLFEPRSTLHLVS